MRKKAVLVVGAGGLGAPAIIALAASGRFTLGLADPERVELSNLARQIIYGTRQVGQFKVEAAARYARETLGFRDVRPMNIALNAANAPELVAQYDFVIDATDDPAVKFLINDVCLAMGRPFCYGGVLGFRGQAMTIVGGETACLRCLFEFPPDQDEVATCREAGIVGSVAGLVGFVQAKEALYCLRGLRPRLAGKLFAYDGAGRRAIRILPVQRREGCACASACSASEDVRAGA
jgi:molybdopterin/thiamine biosynthesis adenylyltransferase